MKSPFNARQFRTMLSHFLVAVGVIIVYKFIMEIDAFLGLIQWLLKIISPFALGFVLAYILNIPCGGIEKWLAKSKNSFILRKRKALSIVSVYVLSFLILFLILSVVIPSLYRSFSLFAANFGHYNRSAQDFINYINSLDILNIDIAIDNILNSVREFTLQKLPSSLNALFSVSTGLFNGILAFISSIYILLEKDNFKNYLNRMSKAFLPESAYHIALKYTKNLNTNFKQYIYTQTIDGCILGTIATIELFFLKSPYALVLGIMLGIVNYIPYFGSIFGTIFTVLVVAFTQDITTMVLAAAILLITQQIDANIIQPRLMSGSFSLSPLLVIISITVGGAMSGMLGMIVAIPIVAVMKDILEEIIAYYEKRKCIDSHNP